MPLISFQAIDFLKVLNTSCAFKYEKYSDKYCYVYVIFPFSNLVSLLLYAGLKLSLLSSDSFDPTKVSIIQ